MKDKHALISRALAIGILFIMLLLTLFTSFSLLTIWFLPIPLMYLAARFGWRTGLSGFAVSMLFLAAICWNLQALLPLFLLCMGTGMGVAIQKKKSAFAILLTGSLVNSAVLIIILAISVFLFNYNPIQSGVAYLTQSFNETIKELGPSLSAQNLVTIRQYKSTLSDLIYLAPSMLVLVSVFYALIIELISLPILRKLHVTVPRWVPFRNWQLPKSIVWVYLLVLIVRAGQLDGGQGTTLFNIVINFEYILQVLLAMQGFSFLFAFAHRRKLPLVVPILCSLLGFVLLEMIRILGIIDLGFDLRKRIAEKH